MTLEIRKLGDPVLREKCREVETVDPEVRELVRMMGETVNLDETRVGLAASQAGVLKRLCVYDIGHGVRCLINPEIIEAEGETVHQEGCLSLPGISVAVPRHDGVKVRFTTLSGYGIVLEAQGFLARVLQHECDHLDGILIIDRCDEEERRRALAEYQELELEREQAGA